MSDTLKAEREDGRGRRQARRKFLSNVANGAALGLFGTGIAESRDAKTSATKGPSPATSPILRRAWDKYNAAVESARVAMENTARYRNNPDVRAGAYRSLIEAEAMAYNSAIAPHFDRPFVQDYDWSYRYNLGGTSPDFYYGTLYLDGRKTYRVSGRFGDEKLILLQVFSRLMGAPNSKMLGNLDVSTFDIRRDGSFDLILSADKHAGNWVPLDGSSDSNFILIRRAMSDWYGDRGGLQIHPMEGATHNDELSETALSRRVSDAADFITFMIQKWNIAQYDIALSDNAGSKNSLFVRSGATLKKMVGSPNADYTWGIFEIGDDDALILESDVPDAGYWSLQVFDVWIRPFDFINRQTDVNMRRAVIDRDGRYRAVISLRDPGTANWLDPAGNREGIMLYRSYHSRRTPRNSTVRLVKFSEVSKYLPRDTRMVTPQERESALAYRRRGYLKMMGGV